MVRKTDYAPRIEAIGSGIARPLWSVMIPTFNCARYLTQTLETVLDQDPGPDNMQIEVVDDCSSLDDPEHVVSAVGLGRVDFFRQRANVGATANFNTCIKRSRGHIVHILHGDDYVLPGFYDRMSLGLRGRETGAAFCAHLYVDESEKRIHQTAIHRSDPGFLDDALPLLALSQKIQFAAMVVRRECYERLGGFNSTLRHAADWEMWVRVAANYSIWFEPALLAAYRIHRESDTSRLVLSGANVRDVRHAERFIRETVPRELRSRVSAEVLLKYGLDAGETARRLLREGHFGGALCQAWQSFRCLSNPNLLSKTAVRLVKKYFG